MVENYRGDMEALNGKTTVKVHHAPGGATSINLFGGYEEEKPKAKAPAAVAQPQPEEEKKDAKPTQAAGAVTEAPAAGGSAGGANLTHTIGGAAPLTSVKYSGNPPGGKSSGPLW